MNLLLLLKQKIREIVQLCWNIFCIQQKFREISILKTASMYVPDRVLPRLF